jgi:hypothetical protein
MILYSVVPPETVWPQNEKFSPNYIDITVNGTGMQVEPVDLGRAKIVRLYSANPEDYMNPRLAPGSIIEWKPMV